MQEANKIAAEAPLPNAPGSKIIRATDEQAWRDGFSFLAGVQQAHAAERAKGFAEGKAAGNIEATKLVAETTAKVDKYIATLDRDVAKLTFDIVRRILGEFDNAELVARAVRQAIIEFRHAKALKVRIHPDAELRVVRMIAEYHAQAENIVPISIERDPNIDPQACFVSSEFTIVEATIETQLEAIAKAMGIPQKKASL